MATKDVNFFTPGTDAGVDMQAVQRQRDLAALLMKSTFDPKQGQGQMVSGHYVPPSILSSLQPALGMLASEKMNERADASQRKMAEALRARNTQEANEFMGAMSGTPGRTIQPLTPNDDEGNAMPVAQTAATPPDRNRAMALALQAQNPQVQAMGGELMKRQMAAAEIREGLEAAGLAPPGGGGGAGPAPTGGAPSPSAPGGLNPQAFALMLSPNQQLGTIGKAIQENSKPMAIAEGGTAYSPTGGVLFTAPKTEAGIGIAGGVAGPVPGFQEAQARREGLIAGSRAAAQDPYATPITVPTAGGPRMMTPAQVRQEAGAGTRSNPAPTEGVTGNFDTGNLEGLRAAIDRLPPQEAANARAALSEQLQRGQTQAIAPSAGAGRGGQGGPGIALQSDEQKAYGEARAKDFAELAKTTQKGAQSAVGTLRNLDTLDALYKDPNVAKGGAAEGISSLKNMAVSMGVDVKGLGAEQGIAAITNKMALEARSTADGGGMPGAMSDADRDFLKALQPGLSKSPEGRATIISASRAVAQRQIEVARMANEYERTHGRLDAGFDRELANFSTKNQMFAGQKAPSAPSASAPDFRALAAQELERRRKGGK